MIEIQGLSKNYGDVKAVENLNLGIRKGEILGFLGPNGAGKSTTIRMLCCFLRPTSGTIRVKGMDIMDNPQAIKSMVGYLPESAPLYGDMIVYDYLEYVANVRQIPKKEQFGVIKQVAVTSAITEVIHKNISELSKGYKQRVGLAHALIGDPEILVLDEPTSGLDPNQIVDIRELIKAIAEKKTIILCSHILSEVEATCDRVVIINKGKIVADGSPEDLKKQYAKEKTIVFELEATGLQREELEAQLEQLPGILRVQSLSQDSDPSLNYQIDYESEQDLSSAIYDMVKNNNWKLVSLYQQKNSLESVFRKLTTEGEEKP